MEAKVIGKELLGVIDFNKLAAVIVDQVIDAELKKLVDDSSNKFDDAAYAMLAPLLLPKAKEALLALAAQAES
jgi:hypothetical protein